jgi:dipeptidyl aminopeptidase/acylaminoacyl peptidase
MRNHTNGGPTGDGGPGPDGYLHEVELSQIAYRSDDLMITGWMAQPRTPGRHPCVIYNRGGTSEDALTYDDATAVLKRIASWGYLVIASQYRGAAASDGADEFGGADVNDVLNLIPLLEQQPEADASRIGMWGWSRGGLMTYRALSQTDRIAAAVIVAGVTDAFDYVARRPDMEQEVFAQLIPNYQAVRLIALAVRSPLRWTDWLPSHTPLLLLHGAADERVHASQSLRMAAALGEIGHPYRLVVFEHGDHALSQHQEEMFAQGRAWLDRYVRDRARPREE